MLIYLSRTPKSGFDGFSISNPYLRPDTRLKLTIKLNLNPGALQVPMLPAADPILIILGPTVDFLSKGINASAVIAAPNVFTA